MQDRGDSFRGAPLIHISILAVLALSACSAAGGTPTPAVTANTDVTALRALERPVLAGVKEASTKLAANDNAGAADQLEVIGTAGKRILGWLDTHAVFARANSAATDCLRETMTDLGEQAESLAPLLRQGGASPDQLNKLRTALGEAANCIQSSD